MSAQEQVDKLAKELKETLDLDELESKITGLKGICDAVCFYKSGCVAYLIQPTGVSLDGSHKKATWLQENTIKLIKSKKFDFLFNFNKLLL